MQQKVKMITAIDLKRLTSILDDTEASGDEESLARLEDKIAHFKVVETKAAPPDLVTMNSMLRGVVKDNRKIGHGEVRIFTLVYPNGANISDGRISVIAPLGIELLGSRKGDVIHWDGADGCTRKLVVEEILYQPESSGDWHL